LIQKDKNSKLKQIDTEKIIEVILILFGSNAMTSKILGYINQIISKEKKVLYFKPKKDTRSEPVRLINKVFDIGVIGF